MRVRQQGETGIDDVAHDVDNAGDEADYSDGSGSVCDPAKDWRENHLPNGIDGHHPTE